MARVVVLAIGTYGDVAPYVGLGGRLREAGHEVRVAAVERFRELVTGAGLEFRALPSADPRELVAGPEGEAANRRGPRGMVSMLRIASTALRRPVPAMIEAVADADVILASMTTALLAAPIAEARGVPCVFLPLQPTTPTREFGPLPLGGRDLGPRLNKAAATAIGKLAVAMFGGTSRWLRSELGLPPKPAAGFAPGELPMLHGISPAVLPRPRDWRPGVEIAGYWWPPPSPGWRPPDELAAFLAAGPPPVYVGFGSVGAPAAARVAGAVGAALRRTGCRAVVQRGWAELEIDGDEVLSVGDIPHDWLFPQMAAVVHHAGAGTTAATLRAGVPSVPVVFTAGAGDQSFWARRLVALGVAPAAFAARRLRAAALADAITRAVTVPAHRQTAADIARRIEQEDGAALVLDTVTAFAAPRS